MWVESGKTVARPLPEQWHTHTGDMTYPENIEWNHDSSGLILTTLCEKIACAELYSLRQGTWERIPVELSENQRQFVDSAQWGRSFERMIFEGDAVLKIIFGFKGYKDAGNSDEIQKKLGGFLHDREISLVWDDDHEAYTGLLVTYQKDKTGNYAWIYKTWNHVKSSLEDFSKRYSPQP